MTQFRSRSVRLSATLHSAPVAVLALLLASCGGGEESAAIEDPTEMIEMAALDEDDVAQDAGEGADTPQPEQPPPPPRPTTQVAAAVSPPTAVDIDSTDWVLPLPFYAAGDEPYWRLDVVDGWFVFRRAGLPEIEAPVEAPARDGETDVFDAAPLSIHVTQRTCRTADGENSRYAATVWFDDVSFDGCGFAGQSAGTSAEATEVADSIRAVDSCLASLGDPALVTGIYERGDRQTALGLRTRDGRLFECVTERGGTAVAFLDQVEPGAAGPWMTSGMRFLRAGLSDTSCEEAEVVTDGGAVLGHLLVKSCRF